MDMKMLIGTIATTLRAIARAMLVIAWIAALATPTKSPHDAERTAIAAPSVPAVEPPAAPAVPAVLEAEEPAGAARASKCGDLPRAPWNTCVALHEHEI
jgi:hypothetical protein